MNTKYKIYIFHPYSKIGGADLSISRLINNLDQEYFEIDFIYLNKQKISNYLNKKNINFINIKSKRTLFSLFKIRKYLQYDKSKKYKKYIFISNQNFANVFSFLLLFKINWIKHILIERNHLDEFKFNNSFKNKLILFLMKLFYNKANAVIGISKKLSKDLSLLTEKKCLTIYNPAFDKNIFKLSKKTISIKKKSNTILTIGRLEDQKDIITILEAFKLLLEKINANLIIIGYGSQYKILKKFIIENKISGNVKILTNIKNPFPYYKIADVFVLGSKYEGFGNVLVEAAMFKLNIISSNCNAGPKEILDNGKYGLLFKVGDKKKLSELMLKSLKDKNLYDKNKLYNHIKKFNLNKNISSYISLFKKI